MTGDLDAFLHQVPNLDEKEASELIEYFVYFLTEIIGNPHARPTEIEGCFSASDIPVYSNVSAYLSNHSRKKRAGQPKFVRSAQGYKLTRSRKGQMAKELNMEPARSHVSAQLRDLVPQLTNPQEVKFLKETIDCYEVGAHRATIVMAWILAVHHLQQHILKHKLTEFNAELAKNTDRRVKIKSVSVIDDFSDIPEGKFIEFARQAKIISNGVRKVLDAKLDIRNSAAHPSGVTVSPVKVTDFVTDLIDNVVLKYPR